MKPLGALFKASIQSRAKADGLSEQREGESLSDYMRRIGRELAEQGLKSNDKLARHSIIPRQPESPVERHDREYWEDQERMNTPEREE